MGLNMSLKWRDVIEKQEYKALPDAEKSQVKLEYFYDVVAPQIPQEENVNDIRSEFLQDAAKIEIDQGKPSFIKDVIGQTIAKSPKRVAGIALGAVNSPLAFVWGSQAAQYLDEKEFNKMPVWKQALVRIGGGIDSALKSTFKEGEWGTLYGDYYKAVTGNTIRDDLRTSFEKANVPDPDILADQLAPTIEFLADTISDPIIMTGAAKNLARFKVPKEWIGKIPNRVINDLKNIEALEKSEKQALQGKLLEALKNRAGYMKWWEDQPISEFEKVVDYIDRTKRSSKIIKSVKPKTPEMLGAKIDKEAIIEAPIKSKQEIAKEAELKSQEVYRGQRASLESRPAKIEAPVTKKQDIVKANRPTIPENFGVKIQERETPELTQLIKSKKTKPIAIFIGYDQLQPEKKIPLYEIRGGPNHGSTVSKFKLNELGIKPPEAKINTTTLKASAGATFGFETDDEGNIYYDARKGLIGAVGGAATIKIVKSSITTTKAARELLSNNPAMAKILSGIGKEKQIFTLPEVIQKLNITLFDRFSPLKNASPKTYEMARKFQAYKDQALLKFRPLVEAFRSVKKDNVLMTAYVKAHRDLTRAERGFKNPGGVTLEDAKQAISEIESIWVSKGNKLEDLQDTMNAFNQWTHDEILFPAYEAGFISKNAYDDILKNNKWYATYDVIDHMPEDINNIPILASSEYFSKSNQNIIKRLEGTEKVIRDPIDSTIQKFTLAQNSIARNKVASTLIDDPNMQVIIKPIATSQKEYSIMKNQGLEPFMQGNVNKKEWGTINRFKDGRVERYAVPKEIADSMKQLSTWQAPKLIRAYNSIFRATATTLSPAFLVRNVFRDAILGYISSPYQTVTGLPKFMHDWGKGAWEAIKFELGKPSLVDDYINAGGSFGWAGAEAFEGGGKQAAKKYLFEKSIFRKSADVIISPFKLTEKLNEIVEMAPRIGIFERGMKLGYKLDDAALAGRQATIDFNRGGTFLKTANQLIPFLNARVQAKVTLYDAFKRDWKGTSAKMISTVMLPGMAAYAWNKLYHPELYGDIPEYIRQDNFCLVYDKDIDKKTGEIIPKFIAIPKGDAGTLFNPFEFALESKYSEDPKSTKEFLINFLSDLSPVEFAEEGKLSPSKAGGSLVPPLVKPFLEDWANLKFYQGTEIVPYYMGESKPPELQYRDNTPEFYKWLGNKTKISPLRIQNYAANLFTTYGRIGFSPKAMEDVIRSSLLKDQGGEYERQAFTQIKSIEQGYNTARAYAEKAIEEGDRRTANILIMEWNKGLTGLIGKYNDKFAKHGFADRGGLRKSYYITMEKRRNILLNKKNSGSFLEKRLMKTSSFPRRFRNIEALASKAEINKKSVTKPIQKIKSSLPQGLTEDMIKIYNGILTRDEVIKRYKEKTGIK